MSPSRDLILDCVNKSKSLLTLSSQERWEQFSDLEEERQQQLSKINLEALHLPENEYDELSALMNELISLNQQLSLECEQQRKIAMREFKKINQGIQANKAYS